MAFWFEKWLRAGPLSIQISENPPEVCSHVRVSYFIQEGQSNIIRLKKWVSEELIQQILHVPISEDPLCHDLMEWKSSPKSYFSVANAYKALHLMPLPSPSFAKLSWKLKLLAKMKFHLWRINHNFLLVGTSLVRYISFINVSCIIYQFHTEDNSHLFRDCPFACATLTHFIPLSTALNYQLFFSLQWDKWLLFIMNFSFGKG